MKQISSSCFKDNLKTFITIKFNSMSITTKIVLCMNEYAKQQYAA